MPKLFLYATPGAIFNKEAAAELEAEVEGLQASPSAKASTTSKGTNQMPSEKLWPTGCCQFLAEHHGVP